MNIAIVEPHYHYSYLHATVRIAQSAGHKVHVFTIQQVWEETRNFFSTTPSCKATTFSTIADLLCHALSAQKDFDVMLINTIQILEWQNLVRLAYRMGKWPTVFTMHLANYWFQHSGYPFWRIRALLRLHCRNVILQKSKGLLFLSEYAPEYAREMGYSRPISVLPFGVREESSVIACKKIASGEKTVFGVPGAINEGRDYDLVLSVFERVFATHGARVCLWFMGWPIGDIGRSVVGQCQILRRQGYDVRWEEDGYVSETRFRAMARETDFFLLPLNKRLFPDGVRASGTVFDALRLEKPFIIPEFYRLPGFMKGGYYSYKNERDLQRCVYECLNLTESDIETLHAHVAQNSTQFCPERWATRFNMFISDLSRG